MAVDAKMDSTVTSAEDYPTWGFNVVNGIVPYVTGDEADLQTVKLACFAQRGLIPQLNATGPDWLGFITGRIDFLALDAMIQQAISDTEVEGYMPVYSTINDRLVLTVQRSK